MTRTVVAMPVKSFDSAKSRLAGTMPGARRERLARALFLRTQRFFASSFPEFDRVIVTPSVDVQKLCERVAAKCVLEPRLEGLNKAAERATDWATLQGYDRIVVIPSDIPVWIRSEVNLLLDCAASHDVVVARAHDGGTNALVITLPARFEFCYGPNSAARHLESAWSSGLSAAACRPLFLSHDLDTPEDCLVYAVSRSLERSL
jgi:2-phospho-L-lactate/phosphoenolpyruvate guanylyltransferase